MSKQSNEKLVSLIASADAKVQRITEGKARAQAQVNRADQEIRETQATRTGYVALLKARGLAENGEALDGGEPETDAPEVGDGDEVAQPEDPQFG